MDSLLCDEVWLMNSPYNIVDQYDKAHHEHDQCCNVESYCCGSFYNCKEDCEEAFRICLQKECNYMPQPFYVDHLKSYNLITPRFTAIQWCIKARRRLNLSIGTVFNAVNYLDRFISKNRCHGWKKWMFELLSVACLSVASKFDETTSPPLHEIQMEDLDHSFESSLIQKAELTLLKVLDWQLRATTPFSYMELLTHNIDSLKPCLLEELATRVNELLLSALLDFRFLEFRPSTVAISALQCIYEEFLPSTSDALLSNIIKLIPLDQKDNFLKCHKLMEERLVDQYCPSSPVTVLTIERAHIYDCKVDLSLSNLPSGLETDLRSNTKKRKCEEQ